jgi:Protein of unknown function (DUF3040)
MISADDRQTLASIEEGLAAAAPELAAMLAAFAGLNAGERMPTRESIRARERAEASGHGRRHRPRGLVRGLALWLLVSASVVLLIAATGLALAANRGGVRPCTDSFSLVCAG